MVEHKFKKEAEAYLKSFLKRLRESPEKLTVYEKRLGGKYTLSKATADKAGEELERLRTSIRQGEERARIMELQIQGELGKADGFLGSIVEIEMERLEAENTKAPDKKKTPAAKKGNGKDQQVTVA